jgi:thymidine kinase
LHQYKGAIIAHIGPMFGGKTSALISDVIKFKIAKYNTVLFKPKKDERYAKDAVVNHRGEELEAINVTSICDVLNYMKENPEVDIIAIDEFQFLKDNLLGSEYLVGNLIHNILLGNKTLIISGLDLDSDLIPFDNVRNLLPYCTHINKHKAVCMVCGADATTSYCKVEKDDQELIGGSDLYEPRCYHCHSLKE